MSNLEVKNDISLVNLILPKDSLDKVESIRIQKENEAITLAKEISKQEFLDLMQLDKKTKEDQINLVLQQGIGKAILTSDYDTEKLHNTLLKKTF